MSENNSSSNPYGDVPIKAEYLVKRSQETEVVKRVADPTSTLAITKPEQNSTLQQSDEDDKMEKKRKNRQERRDQRKKMKKPPGQARKVFFVSEKNALCSYFVKGNCQRTDCKWSHDVEAYEATKQDLPGPCPIEALYGKCRFYIRCQYYSSHKDKEKVAPQREEDEELESIFANMNTFKLRKQIRKKELNLPKTEVVKKALQSDEETKANLLKVRPEEKKRIDFKNLLYLAPLTTVGNVPFRRICKKFGADVTCSEMALGHAFLQSNTNSEWALLRRDASENLFGVQLCGCNVEVMGKVAEVLSQPEFSIDFIDINFGCPIDLVWNMGAGSFLLERPNRIVDIVSAVDYAGIYPTTCKIRTGILSGKPTAGKVLPRLANSGHCQLVTLHGRSREQRYSKLADWDYIKQCGQEFDRSKMQYFGNGDVLSWEDYQRNLQMGVDGVMIGRGALIKPWIFTEIKEQRTWDISSRERFDMLCDFAKAGVENWGSDAMGLNHTRKFLLEWLSFLWRYVPAGLLEVLPQKLTQRPPLYRGRDELETLMASDDPRDWIRLTERIPILGKAPEGFYFEPKHKSNSYEVEG